MGLVELEIMKKIISDAPACNMLVFGERGELDSCVDKRLPLAWDNGNP